MVLFSFQFYPVCNFRKFINFRLGTVKVFCLLTERLLSRCAKRGTARIQSPSVSYIVLKISPQPTNHVSTSCTTWIFFSPIHKHLVDLLTSVFGFRAYALIDCILMTLTCLAISLVMVCRPFLEEDFVAYSNWPYRV